MLEDMEGGRLLSQCLAAHPSVFGAVFVSLVKAGEQTGRLTEVFENLGSALRWQDELASQTKRLLAYPLLVLVVVCGVLVFLLVYLVPQVVGLLKTMGVAMPHSDPRAHRRLGLHGQVLVRAARVAGDRGDVSCRGRPDATPGPDSSGTTSSFASP